jgi:2-iminobutanoate/2-iminopropanoate deaminase
MSLPFAAPYSAIVRAGDWLIVSGQLGMVSGQLAGPTVYAQTVQALTNMKALLHKMEASLDDVRKTTCFLTDMNTFDEFNQAYATFFNEGALPARSTVGVSALPFGGLVEIEAWAYRPTNFGVV